ncbi:hypothetical protein R6Z07F_006815 [Ovis aries]
MGRGLWAVLGKGRGFCGKGGARGFWKGADAEVRVPQLRSWAEKRDALNLVIPEDKEDLEKIMDVYKELKHLNRDWSLVESSALQDPSAEEDVIGPAKALLLLQYTYKLDLTTLSKGVLPGTKYPSTLSVGDCFRLGQTALSISDLHHSMLWMQQALKQLNAGEHSTISKVQVLDHLSDISFWLGDLYRAVDFTHQLLSLDETAEFLQVADYGIGGHYEPHVDSFLDFDSNPLEFIVTGNRVATFMNYGKLIL